MGTTGRLHLPPATGCEFACAATCALVCQSSAGCWGALNWHIDHALVRAWRVGRDPDLTGVSHGGWRLDVRVSGPVGQPTDIALTIYVSNVVFGKFVSGRGGATALARRRCGRICCPHESARRPGRTHCLDGLSTRTVHDKRRVIIQYILVLIRALINYARLAIVGKWIAQKRVPTPYCSRRWVGHAVSAAAGVPCQRCH